MGPINRSVVVIKPKRPFLEWTQKLPDPLEGLTLERLYDDSHAYLFPEWDTHAQREELLGEAYDYLFEWELFGWHRDERAFPKKRTLAMFREWFEVEFHSVVVDLVDGKIKRDEDCL